MASGAPSTEASAASGTGERLEKDLTLFDVYVIGLGPMLSSGFFLLPGLAAAMTGSSVVLAYFLASLLAVPAALSIAELSTAMPRAGGIYYFLDRSLGPMVGTVGGLGTWLVLVLKSAFALVGMGAYLALFIHLPIRTVAIVLTLVFAAVNMVGAKHTGGLQRVLVGTVLGFLVLFLGQALVSLLGRPPATENGFEPFMSLLTASLIYVAGVYVMAATITPEAFHGDLTPFATAGTALFGWLPRPVALALVALPALAGLAASANAGLLAGSRYPLAMARDKLVSPLFARVGRFGTPTVSIFATAVLMVFTIAVLDVLNIAKLASAFLLLIFSILNLAVIVMRESGLESYDPGFRAPLYPWVHVLGLLVPFLLIAEMGIMPIVFSIGLVAVCLVWYFHYARRRIERAGALLHWFHRLARRPYEGAELELRGLLKEEGQPTLDPFDEVIGRAFAVDLASEATFADAAHKAAQLLAERLPVSAERLATGFLHGVKTGATPVLRSAALPHLRLAEIDSAAMVIMRCLEGMQVAVGDQFTDRTHGEKVHALFFLVSPWPSPGNHLRTLAEIVARVAQADFLNEWLSVPDKRGFKEVILRNERFLSLGLQRSAASSVLIGRPLSEIYLPKGSLIALIHRGLAILVPRGDTILREDDRLSIVGDPEAIREIGALYGSVSEGQ
jgi:amino acid transporter/mannitol/fructose-specific phosphotransferase system IIA component (Ntr-type)